jgi:hypothetical protein
MNILTALKTKSSYPLSNDTLMAILIQRDLNSEEDFTKGIADSRMFQGAVADLYILLATQPNITEGGMSVSQNDASTFLSLANRIYKNIGETDKGTNQSYTRFIGYKG